ncbi:MAG: hypothetical protein HQL95_02985 [Magnetococcales bacterium]|nr:hypothetical protein [Magnetococcales bacterium]
MMPASDTLDRLLSATAFAEAGEFVTARTLARGMREILLVLQAGEPQPEVLVTTRSMMERLDAGVEILLAGPETEQNPTLTRFLEEVNRQGRTARLIHRPGIPWKTVLAYAGGISGIVCILVESLEKWGLQSHPERRRPPPWSQRLPCPLVVASPIEKATI